MTGPVSRFGRLPEPEIREVAQKEVGHNAETDIWTDSSETAGQTAARQLDRQQRDSWTDSGWTDSSGTDSSGTDSRDMQQG